ncbi:MAG: hypothetical protein COZ08_09305 [Bacteroidetes bacterium CG_4_10_14_3_um_filter_42_6]|nr:MAG: hypothetical protein COZ08_09305 [Bacteroidetes bacterium CG_4_10_14_3_um_filter_42_6]PJB58658.1 MAG: hypothetical protein CO098_07495 [Bacteroidetes bacterium CG_4_9_14_3_um_filter_41_19]
MRNGNPTERALVQGNPQAFRKRTPDIGTDNTSKFVATQIGKARLEARIFQQLEGKTTIGSNVLEQVILKSAELIEKINEYNQQIETFLAKRKNQPTYQYCRNSWRTTLQ